MAEVRALMFGLLLRSLDSLKGKWRVLFSCACSWGYAVLVSKFAVLFLDAGIAKSFGVLIPIMVERLDSEYATVGLICSMPATLSYLFFPFVKLLLQRFTNRSVAMTGGVLSGASILACAFIQTTPALGVCLALSGVGLSMAHLPSTIAVNDYFPQNFVFISTLTLYGYTAGSMFLPVITEKAVEAYGYSGAFVILSGIAFNTVVCGAALREAPGNVDPNAPGARKRGEDKEMECSRQNSESSPSLQGNTGTVNRLGNSEETADSPNFHQPGLSRQTDRQSSEVIERLVRKTPQSRAGPSEGEHSFDETETDMPEQRSLIRHKTQRDDLSAKNLLQKASLFWTWARSWSIVKEPLFLFSLPINFLLAYTGYAWMFFLVPNAEHVGIEVSQAVFLSTIGGIGGIIGRTFFIILKAKGVDVFIVYIVVGIICTTSFLLDFVGSTYEVRAVLAFSQGFCLFIEDTILNTLCKATVFDDSNFDVAFTLGGFMMGVGATCSGLLTGYLFDVTQSFSMVFLIIGFIHGVSVVLVIIIWIILRKRTT